MPVTNWLAVAGLTAAILTAGCMSIPLSSIVELSRIDFSTTDFEVMRIAIRLPDAMRPRPDGVRMDTSLTLGGKPVEKSSFLLVPAQGPLDRAQLNDAEPPGFATYAYRLSLADLKRLESLRADLKRREKEGARGTLAIGIATTEFCRVRPVPGGPLPVTTYLLTSETGRYVVVTDRYDLRQHEKTAHALASLGPC